MLFSAGTAFPAGETVAVIPAHAFQGPPENGPAFTEALRADLEKRGFTVLPAERVQTELKNLKIETNRALSLAEVRSVQQATGADYVVYARVLGTGIGISDGERRATILVNVLAAQNFVPAMPEKAVMSRTDAEGAVAKVMPAFYEKIKPKQGP
jgi:hypothetical protein